MEKEINLTDNWFMGPGLLDIRDALRRATGPKRPGEPTGPGIPKETWAAATWLCYLVYMHLRKAKLGEWQTACVILLVSFPLPPDPLVATICHPPRDCPFTLIT